MKTKLKLLIGTAAIITSVGFAFATPIVGLVSPLLSVGKQNADLKARGHVRTASGERFKVELETEGPSTLSTQAASIAAGGHNGWHSHPGMVFVTVVSGSIRWYDENCVPTDYKAGDSWVEGSKVHAFRVTSTTAVQLMAWFVTAQGEALRTDEPAPACDTGLGL